MTPKQRRFADEYLIDLNAVQAATRAGYSARSARMQGPRLLSNDAVRAYITERQAAIAEKAELDAVWVLKNLQEVVERCMQKSAVLKFDPKEKRLVQLQDHEGRDVWQFDSQGANKALELIGKHLGMFTDKLQLDGKLISMEHISIELLQRISGTGE